MKVNAILENKGNRVVAVSPRASMHIVIGRMMLERIGAVVVSRDGQTGRNPVGAGYRPRFGKIWRPRCSNWKPRILWLLA
jgi:hypothetical protein